MDIYADGESRNPIIGGSIDFSLDGTTHTLAGYGDQMLVETSFRRDSDVVEDGRDMEKAWDTALEVGWNAQKIKDDGEVADVWTKYRAKVNALLWGDVDRPAGSPADKAERGDRELFEKLVKTTDDGDFQNGQGYFKDSNDDWKTLADKNFGAKIENNPVPSFRLDGSAENVVSEFQNGSVAFNCTFKSNRRLLEIKEDGNTGLDYSPMFVMMRDRYQFQEARDAERTLPGDGFTNEVERDDSDKLQEYIDRQFARVNRQKISGNVVFAGNRQDVKIGDVIQNIILRKHALVINQTVTDRTYDVEANRTSIVFGNV